MGQLKGFACLALLTPCTGYHLKRNKTIAYFGTEMKPEAGPPGVLDCPKLFRDTRVKKSLWLLGRCSRKLRKNCAGANMLYLRAELVLIFECQFASKSLAAVGEAFSNVYRKKLSTGQANNTPTGNISGHTKCLPVTSAHRATKAA
jgi:hypothetical protein